MLVRGYFTLQELRADDARRGIAAPKSLGFPALKRPGYPFIDDPAHPLWKLSNADWAGYTGEEAAFLCECMTKLRRTRWFERFVRPPLEAA